MENSGQALVFIILLTCVLIVVWRVWIGMYCKKRKNSILTPEEQRNAAQQLQKELMETLSGKRIQ